MKEQTNYLAVNKESWNQRTKVHIQSDFYAVEAFKQGKNSLNEIELQLLPDLKGKKVLHLQCHFGQDSIALARMGAVVTGVDLSDEAIKEAKLLAEACGENVSFICCDVYDLPNHLTDTFDFIFTSYGVIGWLPDTDKWANIVAHYLKEKGELLFVEFHPVVWMFDQSFSKIQYSYFNVETIEETDEKTYAENPTEEPTDNAFKSVTWNHSISEVVTSLLEHNMQLIALKEYDYSPYNCFDQTEEYEKGKFRIQHLQNKIPMVYAIKAMKKNS